MFKIYYIFLFFMIGCSTFSSTNKKKTTEKDYTVVTLKNTKGNKVEVMNYGARLMSWTVKDKKGEELNIVLGFETKEAYKNADAPFYGAIVGRYANRLENFEIDGKKYSVTEGDYLLHGGKAGFHNQIWSIEEQTSSSVVLSYLSKDGQEGFPGNLLVKVKYTLTDQNELQIDYEATTDKKTVVNLTNHAFFNLKGAGNGSVEDLYLKINANQFTPIKEGGVPTGQIKNLENSGLDFRSFKTVGDALHSEDEQIHLAKGIDHNFVNLDTAQILITAIAPTSKLKMEMKTTLPGVQVFTAHFLTGNDIGKDGKAFRAKEAICFEAQFFANAPQHSNFPSVILEPNNKMIHQTSYKVSLENNSTEFLY